MTSTLISIDDISGEPAVERGVGRTKIRTPDVRRRAISEAVQDYGHRIVMPRSRHPRSAHDRPKNSCAMAQAPAVGAGP